MNRSVLAVGLVGFCAFLGLYATQPLLPTLQQTFGASKVAVSLTISFATLGVSLAAPWVGILADLRGRKKVIVPAVWLLGTTYLLAATSTNLGWLVFFRFLQGVLTPAVFAVIVAYVNEEFSAAEAGFVTSVYVSGTVLGGFTGRLLSGLLTPHITWRGAFVALGVLNFVIALAISAWLPKAKRFHRASSLRDVIRDMGGHLRNRSLLTIYAVGFTILFSLVASFTYVVFHLAAEPFSLGPQALGSISTVYLVGVVVTPLAGKWSSRIQGWKFLSMAQLLSVAGLLVTLHPRIWSVIVGLTLCSTGVFICQIITNRSIGIVAGHARASAVGLYVTIYYFGGFAGSIIPGLVWQLGGWPTCVALIGTVLILAQIIVLTVWRPREAARRRQSLSAADATVG